MPEPTASPSAAGGPDSPVVDEPMIIDGHELVRRVGSDNYGTIFVAHLGDERCVLTLLNEELVIDVVAARRFAQEVDRVRGASGHGVIPTQGFHFESQPRWISSDFMSGQLLRQRVEARGPLQQPAVRLLATQLARALQALHASRVVQRDLSPDSVLLGSDGAYLWHSGWAGLVDGSDYAGTTHTQHVEWLSPEQVMGEPPSSASDVHAWAVTVLYAATGHNPFDSDHASTSVALLMRETPLIPPVFDPVLASLVAGALGKDPVGRPSARDLLTFLDPSAMPADTMPAVGGVDLTKPARPSFPESDVDETQGVAETQPIEEPQPRPGVDLRKSPVDHPVETQSLSVEHIPEDLEDEEVAEWDAGDQPEGALLTRRVSMPRLVVLSIVVIGAGSVVGVLIGRLLGG